MTSVDREVVTVIAIESQVTAEGAWTSVGVDDLTKYRVIEYLYRPESQEVEVGSNDLADALGFRSVEQLEDELFELLSRGLVAAGARDGVWRVAVDNGLRSRIAGLLLAEDEDNARKGEVISALARRSLARTRARARGGATKAGARSANAGQMRLYPLRSAS